MAFKQIIYKSHNDIETVVKKKSLNKFLYNKYFVRNNAPAERRLSVIDDSFNFEILNYSKLESTVSGGGSYSANFNLYQNTSNNDLKFNLHKKFSPDIGFLSEFNSIISGFSKTRRKFRGLVLLSPIKGGFSCYSSGLCGFLPTSHVKFLLRRLFYKIKNIWSNNRSLQLLQIVYSEEKKKRNFLFRFPLFFGKISFFPSNKLRNFSKNKSNKTIGNNLNIVFLSKNKNVKNKKTSKKNFNK